MVLATMEVLKCFRRGKKVSEDVSRLRRAYLSFETEVHNTILSMTHSPKHNFPSHWFPSALFKYQETSTNPSEISRISTVNKGSRTVPREDPSSQRKEAPTDQIMFPRFLGARFLKNLPVVKLPDLWAHQQCHICQEAFHTWAEKPLKLP